MTRENLIEMYTDKLNQLDSDGMIAKMLKKSTIRLDNVGGCIITLLFVEDTLMLIEGRLKQSIHGVYTPHLEEVTFNNIGL